MTVTAFAPLGIVLWLLLLLLLAAGVQGAVLHGPGGTIFTLFIVLYLIFYSFGYYAGFLREKNLALQSLEKLLSGATPLWDNRQGLLSYRAVVVRRFRHPSSDGWKILDTFEQQGWPPRIDDPLAETGDGDRRQRLAEAIQVLNANEEISFTVDKSGEGVFWAPRC